MKPSGHGLQPLYLRVLQGSVCGDGAEHFQDLVESSLECVKLSKNVHLAEVKLSLGGGLFELLLRFVEILLVLLENTV